MNTSSKQTKDPKLNECGLITWKISNKDFKAFLNSKNGKLLKSDMFDISGIQLYFECYPNGIKRTDKNNVDLFLCIHEFPEHLIAKITLCFSLFCLQSNTQYSKIKTFTKNTNHCGWPFHTLLLSDIRKLNIKYISFQANIKILQTSFYPQNNNKCVVGRIIYHNCSFVMNKYSTLQWNISQYEYDLFMNCNVRQEMKSQKFGSQNMFQLLCYPNGSNVDSKKSMFVSYKHSFVYKIL